MAFIYWLTDDTSEDVWSYGYVGITSRDYKERLVRHKHSYSRHSSGVRQSSAKLYNKIRSIGGWNSIKMVILCEGSLDYCTDLEYQLRSLPRVGWNVAVGGSRGGMTGRCHSEETRNKMREAHKSRSPVSEETKRKIALARKRSPPRACGERNYNFKRPAWLAPSATETSLRSWRLADEIYDTIVKNPSIGYPTVVSLFCKLSKQSCQVIVNKIKTGWIPKEDKSRLVFKEKYDDRIKKQTKEKTI